MLAEHGGLPSNVCLLDIPHFSIIGSYKRHCASAATSTDKTVKDYTQHHLKLTTWNRLHRDYP